MEELRELTPLDLEPEFTAESFVELVAPLRDDEKERIVFETVHKRKDQTLYDVEVHLQLLKHEHEALFAAIILDITERVQAEAKLRLQSAALESAANALVITDAEGDIQWANPAFIALTGYSLEEALGQNPRFLKSSQQDEAFYKNLWDTITAGEVWHGKIINKRKDGMFYTEEMTITPLTSDLGEITNFIAIKQDITERKQAEEDIRRTTDEINRLYRASGALLASASPNLESLAQTIIETIIFEFEHTNCSLILVDSDSASLKRVAVAGPYTKDVSQSILKLDGDGLVPEAVRSGEIINVPDVTAASNYEPNWAAARSEMVIPLKVDQRVIGVIDVQSAETSAFSADDQRLMAAFVDRAALVLENTRLFDEARRRLERLSSLHTIDKTISASMDLSLTTNVIAQQVQAQLEVDAVSILVHNLPLQSLWCAARRGFDTVALEHTDLRVGSGLAGQAALNRRIFNIDNLAEHPDAFSDAPELAVENFVSYWGVPLIAKGEIKGVLEIFHRAPLHPNREWQDFLKTLAGQAAIAIDNATLFTELQTSNQELRLAYDTTLEGWARALEMRDMETEGHSRRVTQLAVKLAASLGMDEKSLVHVQRGALLHDIGKMGIPDAILQKPGPLTDEEWEIMRQHPVYAYEWLSPIDYLRRALDIPYCHHEKWDGSGYPRDLLGEQIPLPARIFAVIDVWDALLSDRPYREAWKKEKVIAYIREQSGKHFDPRVVEAFLKIIEP